MRFPLRVERSVTLGAVGVGWCVADPDDVVVSRHAERSEALALRAALTNARDALDALDTDFASKYLGDNALPIDAATNALWNKVLVARTTLDDIGEEDE